jgi:hypothetical protein
MQETSGRIVEGRDVFRAEQMLTLSAGQPLRSRHGAEPARERLSALPRETQCDGTYWFRLFPRPHWLTTRLANGRYGLRVEAWDVAGNSSSADTVVTVRNPPLGLQGADRRPGEDALDRRAHAALAADRRASDLRHRRVDGRARDAAPARSASDLLAGAVAIDAVTNFYRRYDDFEGVRAEEESTLRGLI